MNSSILQEAFDKVYRLSPAPIQLAFERSSILSPSLGHHSALNSSINNMFDKTVDCNQSIGDIQAMKPTQNTNIISSKYAQKLFLWIIKPIPQQVGICVEGKRSLDDEEFWHSGMVTHRYSSNIVGTSSGSKYQLMGEIVLLDTIDAGIPEPLAKKYKTGFPINWSELLDEYLQSDMEVNDNSIVTQGPAELLDITNLVSQQTTLSVPNNQLMEPANGISPINQLGETSKQTECNNQLVQLTNTPTPNNQYVDTVIANKLSKPTYDYNQNNTSNIVVPSSIGANITANSLTDQVLHELCNEQEILSDDSILNNTMVDKVLVDKVKTSQLKVTQSKKSIVKKSVNSNVINIVDTQDKTPFSRRLKKLISPAKDCEKTRMEVDTSEETFSEIEISDPEISSRNASVGKRSSHSNDKEKLQKTKGRTSIKVAKSGSKRRTLLGSNKLSKSYVESLSCGSASSTDENVRIDPIIKSPTKITKGVVSLHNWIIRPLHKTKGVIVEGKRKGQVEYWRSSSIAERIDQRTVKTDSGSIYQLVGNIEKLDAIDGGFSLGIVKSFKFGFPNKWNELIEKHYVNEERLSMQANSKPVSRRKPVSEDLLNGTIVGTPAGQFVDINSLRQTRSGRIVKPTLAAWAGQRVVYDYNSCSMKVVYNTKYAESYFTEQSIQLSTKSTKSVRRHVIKETDLPKQNLLKSEEQLKQQHYRRKSTDNVKMNSNLQRSKTKPKLPINEDEKEDETDANSIESVNLEQDVLKIVNDHKRKRSMNRLTLRTCYNTSRIHMKKQVSSNSDNDTETDNNILSPSSRTRSKDIKSLNHEPIVRKRTQTVSVSDELGDTDSQIQTKPKSKSRQTVTSKTKTSQNKKQSVDITDAKSKSTFTNKKDSLTCLKQNNSKMVKKCKHVLDSPESEDDDSWGKSEVFRLESALRSIHGNDKMVWKRLAEAVETRSVTECQEFLHSNKKYKSFLESTKVEKKKEAVEVTAKKGTMKRRKQIREFLEQDIEDDDQDLFDATPFRAKVKKTHVPRLDEDVFSAESDFPITPGANYRTPSMKYYQTQFSAKKTPAEYAPSPVVNPINTVKADKVVHNYLKRRKLSKPKPNKKISPIPASNKPRILFSTDKADEYVFNESGESEWDEDEEKDHYMSDGSS